jgi:catechol 2,3-dioxygenase-like lactoylglutathione lyase family enzyme
MIKRLDHTGLIVEDLAAAVAFFVELGMELEGEAQVGGEWADQLLGLEGMQADMVVVRTPDGHGRVELSSFISPLPLARSARQPVNTPGIPRITFIVEELDDLLARLRPHGAELVGQVAQYEEIYRYCYIRGPADVIIGLAEDLR